MFGVWVGRSVAAAVVGYSVKGVNSKVEAQS